MKLIIILLLCVLMSASCKEMKVGLDDETIDAIDGLTGGADSLPPGEKFSPAKRTKPSPAAWPRSAPSSAFRS